MDYKELENQIWDQLGEAETVCLATSFQDQPSVRTISAIFLDKKIYFQTDCTMRKAIEIHNNPKVSVCIRGVEVQGICEELSHPYDKDHKCFLKQFAKYYENACKQYSHLQDERVYVIIPQLIKRWRTQDGWACIEYLYVHEKRGEVKKLYEVNRDA